MIVAEVRPTRPPHHAHAALGHERELRLRRQRQSDFEERLQRPHDHVPVRHHQPANPEIALPEDSPEKIGTKVAAMAELFVKSAPKLLDGIEAPSESFA